MNGVSCAQGFEGEPSTNGCTDDNLDVVLTGCTSNPSMQSELRVMTFNTFLIGEASGWKWWAGKTFFGGADPWHPSKWDRERVSEISKQICDSGADVVGMQELWTFERDLLRQLSECGYVHQISPEGTGTCLRKSWSVSCLTFDSGVGMVSKFPLQDQFFSVFDDYKKIPRGFISAKVLKDGIKYNIISLHQQSWDTEDDDTVEVRRKQGNQVKNHINLDNVDVAIIMGDFNYASVTEIHDDWRDDSLATNEYDKSNRETWLPLSYYGYDDQKQYNFLNLDNIVVLSKHERMSVDSVMQNPATMHIDNQDILISDHNPLFATITKNRRHRRKM